MSHRHSHARLALATIVAAGVAGGPHASAGAESASAVTVSSGDLYAYGHHLPPPYMLVVRDGVLTVNGIRVFPPLRRPPVPDTDPLKIARQRHELTQRVFTLQAELERAGRATAEITPRLIEHLRAENALVDSVTGVRDDAFWVWWRGDPQPEQFLVRTSRSAPAPNAQAEEERDLLRHALERDCLVIIAPSRQLVFPPDPPERIKEVLAEIERARDAASDELTREHWFGRHLDHDLARLFQHPLTLPLEE